MKKSLLILALQLIATTSPAASLFLKADVFGTVQSQELTNPSSGRIKTATLKEKDIFQEFQVSKSVYELVLNVSSAGELLLLPKHTGAGLPSLEILSLGGGSSSAINTKTGISRIESHAANSTATNLFKALDGEILGTIQIIGLSSTPSIKKFNFSFTGHSASPANNNSAILKFKVTTKGVFSQAP